MKLKQILLLMLALSLTVGTTSYAKDMIRSVQGRVAKVSDGDTLQVITENGTKLKVRLAGVDCPETPKINKKTGRVNKLGQPYGEEAKAFVEKLVGGKTIRVDIYGVDQYQRVLAFVTGVTGVKGSVCPSGYIYVPSDGNCKINLNIALVQAGLAEVYHGGEFGPFKRELIEEEREARNTKRGMWSLGNQYESPGGFRKRLRVRGK